MIVREQIAIFRRPGSLPEENSTTSFTRRAASTWTHCALPAPQETKTCRYPYLNFALS